MAEVMETPVVQLSYDLSWTCCHMQQTLYSIHFRQLLTTFSLMYLSKIGTLVKEIQICNMYEYIAMWLT